MKKLFSHKVWFMVLVPGIMLLMVVYIVFPQCMEMLSRNSDRPKTDMVDIEEYIPGLVLELVYASPDNIHGQTIYDLDKAYLRRGTAEKLKRAQEDLRELKLGLKVWDAYRPPQAQYKLWEIMPDKRFVANPYEGSSYHSRGVAVDLTLVDEKGRELPMPSSFDDFTSKADRDYSDVSAARAENAKLLEEIMVENGFTSIYFEWWHFTDEERDQYDIYEIP